VITLFPDLVQPVLGQSMLKQVLERMLLEAAREMYRLVRRSMEFLGARR
jgi:hypothetical protein